MCLQLGERTVDRGDEVGIGGHRYICGTELYTFLRIMCFRNVFARTQAKFSCKNF